MVVTGPRGSGKTRWLQSQIRDLSPAWPGCGISVLLLEEGRTRMDGFSKENPGVSVRRLVLPCLCCAGLTDLPAAVRAFVDEVPADWLFLELPAVAAFSLIADFDRFLKWPRSLIVCLDRTWAAARASDSLSPFQSCLLAGATGVVEPLDR